MLVAKKACYTNVVNGKKRSEHHEIRIVANEHYMIQWRGGESLTKRAANYKAAKTKHIFKDLIPGSCRVYTETDRIPLDIRPTD